MDIGVVARIEIHGERTQGPGSPAFDCPVGSTTDVRRGCVDDSDGLTAKRAIARGIRCFPGAVDDIVTSA